MSTRHYLTGSPLQMVLCFLSTVIMMMVSYQICADLFTQPGSYYKIQPMFRDRVIKQIEDGIGWEDLRSMCGEHPLFFNRAMYCRAVILLCLRTQWVHDQKPNKLFAKRIKLCCNTIKVHLYKCGPFPPMKKVICFHYAQLY